MTDLAKKMGEEENKLLALTSLMGFLPLFLVVAGSCQQALTIQFILGNEFK